MSELLPVTIELNGASIRESYYNAYGEIPAIPILCWSPTNTDINRHNLYKITLIEESYASWLHRAQTIYKMYL